MGMMIGSMSSNRNKQVIDLKDVNGNVVGRITKSGGNSNGKKPKKLMYNFKLVSARILQTKTSGNARQTVILAQNKLAELRQKVKGRGEYDDAELEAAIIHAEKMVRIAKKKQKNLLEEEKAAQGLRGEGEAVPEAKEGASPDDRMTGSEDIIEENSDINNENRQRMLEQLMRQMEQMMQEAMRTAEETDGMDELSEELMATEDMEPEDLELRKKKHRADEMREIVEADMKYLKTLFDKLEREKQSSTSGLKDTHDPFDGCGVSLELGGAQVPVAEGEAAAPVEGGNMDMTI